MNVPADYRAGYEQARAVDAELAERCIAHTVVGELAGEIQYLRKPRFVTLTGVLVWFRWKQRLDALVRPAEG